MQKCVQTSEVFTVQSDQVSWIHFILFQGGLVKDPPVLSLQIRADSKFQHFMVDENSYIYVVF